MTEGTNPKDLIGMKKPRMSLIPPAGLVWVAKAMENGAEKYQPYNWRDKKIQTMPYIDAILRHTYSFLDGEDKASDSHIPHLAHIAATALIMLDAIESKRVVDNRPVVSVTAELIERLTRK